MTTKHTDKTEGSWEDHPMSAFGGHLLDVHLSGVKGVEGGDITQQLADLGVTDVEQLVALTNSKEGLNNLADTLGIDKKEVEHLAEAGKKALPANLVAELAHPLSAQFSLGVLEPTPEMREAAEAMSEAIRSSFPAVKRKPGFKVQSDSKPGPTRYLRCLCPDRDQRVLPALGPEQIS